MQDTDLYQLLKVNDRFSRERLAAVGLRPDARCLEVGTGAGTIACWLAEQVVGGKVVATDIDENQLAHVPQHPRLTAVRHDIANDPLDQLGEPFDLIYARGVLAYPAFVPDAPKVLAELADALAAGGVLMVEEFCTWQGRIVDAPDLPRAERLFGIYQRYMDVVWQRAGEWGWQVHPLMREAELVDIRTVAGGLESWAGGHDGSAGCRAVQRSIEKFRTMRFVRRKDRRALDELSRLLDDPRVVLVTGLRTSTAGRRPT